MLGTEGLPCAVLLSHMRRSFQVSCSALTTYERRLAAQPSGLPALEGWFKVCTAGGANSPQLAAAAAAAASTTAANSLALVPAGIEPGTSPASAAGAVGCSEYCVRLAEAVYTVCEHAVELLVRTAPAIDKDEVESGRGLGPMWPSQKALVALLVSVRGSWEWLSLQSQQLMHAACTTHDRVW